MFSSIRKKLKKVFYFKSLFSRLGDLEKRLVELERITDSDSSLELIVDEITSHEHQLSELLQDELDDAIIRSMKTHGDA
jgi:hypothetical protein